MNFAILKLLSIASIGVVCAVVTTHIIDQSGRTEEIAGGTQADTQKPSAITDPPDFPSPSAKIDSPTSSADSNTDSFHVGDKLRIDFYERLDQEEEKWGRMHSSRSAFRQRMEFSGEYLVADDGTISLPLIGAFAITKRSNRDLEGAAEALLGRKGFVTVSVIEHQPVYVLGPVKKPGSYKYASGMTVLHAVALAGGLDRITLEPWQRVESVRENGKRQEAIERIARLLALAAVLKSEHDGSPIQVPPRLTEAVGEEDARRLISEQREHRQTAVWLQGNRASAMKAAVDNAKNEVAILFDGTKPFDEIIKLKAERVENVKTLIKSNVLANPVLVQVQSELSDVQERKQTALAAVALAKQRLALAEQELTRQHAQAQAELEQEITTTDQAITDDERELEASKGVLNALSAGSARGDAPLGETDVVYQIVRRDGQEASVFAAAGTVLLEPGDLVRVRQKAETLDSR
jgi:polysaccharide biosynthesis/export protein ExoF